MSSLRNAIPRRAHKERAQPQARKKFGILEKHKDYVERAKSFHKKEETLRILRQKAMSRNPDEFYFKMINSRVIDGVHRAKNQTNKYSHDELMLMKTQDIGYVLQKLQSEKKKVNRLSGALHALDNKPINKHVYYAEDREEAKEIRSRSSHVNASPVQQNLPRNIRKKTTSAYRELEERKRRVEQLEKLYSEMAFQKELQKPGRKRKLREEEMVSPTSRPVYKWRAERKR